MLPTAERLTRAGLFKRAYTARRNINTPCLTLYVLPRQDSSRLPGKTSIKTTKTTLANSSNSQELARIHLTPLPLVGFVVAKKVCKSACVRNKAKRRVREAYRLMRLSNAEIREKLAQWYAMVFVVHTKALDASWTEIQEAVLSCVSKACDKYGRQESANNATAKSAAVKKMVKDPAARTSEGDLK